MNITNKKVNLHIKNIKFKTQIFDFILLNQYLFTPFFIIITY